MEMFSFEVELCVNKSLHDALPSSTSDERACTAVGSSNNQTNGKHTDSLASAISKLATAIEQLAPTGSTKAQKRALSADAVIEKKTARP